MKIGIVIQEFIVMEELFGKKERLDMKL